MEDAILQLNWLIFFQAFVTLFAVFDPVGNLPLFLSITGNMSKHERRRVIQKSCLVALGILILFAYGGVYLFSLFGITINDFRIIGGIILLIFAVDYVLGRGGERFTLAKKAEEIAAFPLATPLLAGPGSISVVMLLVNPPYGPVTTFITIILNVFLAWLILFLGGGLHRVLGSHGSDVVSRIMGLIVGAIAVMFIREGILGTLRGLG